MARSCPNCGSRELTTLGAMELGTGEVYEYEWGCRDCRAIVIYKGDNSGRLEAIPLKPGAQWFRVSFDLAANPPVISEDRTQIWEG